MSCAILSSCPRRLGVFLVAGAAALLLGCSGSPAPAGVSGNAQSDTSVAIDVPVLTELPKFDVATDAPVATTDALEPREFGWPCSTNADCNSGWCVPTATGTVCSVLCIDSCEAAGWACKPVPTLADPAFVCLPLFPHLCEPCTQDVHCTSGLGDSGDKCVSFGAAEGSFCGGDCSSGVPCPDGYECQDQSPAAGAKKQCVPTSKVCTCSGPAVSAKAATVCSRSNEHGTCKGQRVCEEAGLTECSSATPALEACNEVDDDCDGETDEAGATGCVTYFKDLDSDTWGVDGDSKCLCAPDKGYEALQAGDCDDKQNVVNPGFSELCNGKDDNCDGATDEPGALGCKDVWADADGDQWGDDAMTACLCEKDADYPAQKGGDCDDGDSATYPGAPEACSGKDTNCDQKVDPENTPGCKTYYSDGDQDGYGLGADGKCLCAPSGSFSALLLGDCDDGQKTVHPDAGEACNGKDDDCDGKTDPEGSAACTMYLKDTDGDGFGDSGSSACLCVSAPPFTVLVGGDCDDGTKAVFPGALEACGGAVDDDCDGATDEADAAGCKTYWADDDGDGYGITSESECLCQAAGSYTGTAPGDCDDADEDVAPGKAEVCNGKDDDCDGVTDEADAVGCKTYYVDSDGDGSGVADQKKCLCAVDGAYTAELPGDCDDGAKTIYPGALEACNGVDDDCDTTADEPNATGCVTFYEDGDKDGYGVAGSTACLCAASKPYLATVPGDCKDTNEEIHPGVTEVCNGADDDCNGTADDEDADGCATLFYDGDDDGYGAPGTEKCLCAATGKWKVSKGGDCNDNDLLVYPGTPCAAATCSSHTFTEALVCGGTGECNVGGSKAPCPGGYLCANEAQCKTSCLKDDDCVTGNFCIAGVCTGQKLDGAQCLDDTQCQSNHCSNGFCCAGGVCCGGNNGHCNDQSPCTDDACSPTFECSNTPNSSLCAPSSCDASEFTAATYCKDGFCAVGGETSSCAGTDPCKVYSCTLSGCKAANAKSGTPCAPSTCDGFQTTSAKTCDGNGACAAGGSTIPCPGGFSCLDATTCHATCATDLDCAPSSHCEGGQCFPDRQNGALCGADNECNSSHCGNGYCCNSGDCCGGKDTQCDDQNPCTTDTCTGAFLCKHDFNLDTCAVSECTGTSYTEPKYCQKGVCAVGGAKVDCGGSNPCLFYFCTASGCSTSPVPIGSPCAAPVCEVDTFTSTKACDGQGQCSLGGTTALCPGGFVCGSGTACRVNCGDDSHCQTGTYCKSGLCTPKVSDGDSCSKAGECASGYCDNGFCCASGKCCSKSTDCDDGNVCTDDTCNVAKQCKTLFNKAECKAPSCVGLTYTTKKTCQSGLCSQGGATLSCGGTNPCVSYGCGTLGCEVQNAPAGVTCAAATCGGAGTLTATKTCDGIGTCNKGGGQQACPGGFICADSATCAAACVADAGCQPDFYCAPGGTCQPKRENGETCTAKNQCKADYCNSGYCCASGKCCSLSANCDDQNVCTNDICTALKQCSNQTNANVCQPASCDGLSLTTQKTCVAKECSQGGAVLDCSGDDPCKLYSCSPSGCKVANAALGTQCAAPACVGSLLTASVTCNATGSCTVGGGSGPCPGGYSCLDETRCRSTCVSDAECASGYYCSAPACQPKRAAGDACASAAQCASNYCSNGYCCEGPSGKCCSQSFHCDDGEPCTSDACTLSFKCEYTPNALLCQTSKCEGLTFTAATYCKDNVCGDGGQTSSCAGSDPCKTYACDLTGCQTGNVAAGIQCLAGKCTGGYLLTQASLCNGTGTCQAGAQAPCPGGLVCANGSSCKTACGADTDCQSGWFCQGTQCQSKRPNGETCTAGKQCTSGYCANGYCCTNTGGTPKCCSVGSNCEDSNFCTTDSCVENVCQNSNNGDQCASPSCDGATYTAKKFCSGGACSNGGSTETCSSSVPCIESTCVPALGCKLSPTAAGTSCGTGSCVGDSITSGNVCDGAGECVAGTGGKCPGGFLCQDSASCRTSCSLDAHCQAGMYCESTKCVTKKPNGQQCTQGNACVSGYCNSGFCCAGNTCCQTAANCEDSNVCTSDSCPTADNATTGEKAFQCFYKSNTLTCAAAACSGLTFTDVKICANKTCSIGGATQDCSGTNACRIYSCSVSGCASPAAPVGTQCAGAVCSGSTLTQARTCNASASCQSATAAACPGNLTCLSASSCRSSCAQDSDCVSGYYCSLPGGQCLAKKSNGSACSSDASGNECISGHCDHKYCCTSGTCCTASSQCEDGNVCTTNVCTGNQCIQTSNTDVCVSAYCDVLTFHATQFCSQGACQVGGATASCGGAQACHVYACSTSGCLDTNASSGTTCAGQSCAGGTLTQAKTCDSGGTCSQGGTIGPCPGNYACLTSVDCRGTCSLDAHCSSGFYCQSGLCLPKKADGDPCTGAAQCQSAWCSNGFCCANGGQCCSSNADCGDSNVCTDDLCQNSVCKWTNNTTPCGTGSCSGLNFTAAATCSGGSCSGGGGTQSCSGTDPCKTYSCTASGCGLGNAASGIQCVVPACTGSTLTTAKQCNGLGACSDGGTTGACPGHFNCKNSSQCHTTCTDSSQCVSGYYCTGGSCTPKQADGQPCGGNGECQSSYCSGGTCCSGGSCCTSATQCADGNVCTTDGCTNFTCTYTNNTTQCAASTCNGLTFTASKFCTAGTCTGGGSQSSCSGVDPCLDYTCSNLSGCGTAPKPQGTVCQAASCAGTTFTPASVCNATSACQASSSQQCDNGVACDGAESCDEAAGCQSGTPPFVCGDSTCHPSCETATSCGADCKCASGYTLSTGEVDSWNTGSGASKLSKYGCNTTSYPGSEFVYTYVAPVTGQVKVELRGADASTDLLVLTANANGCDPASCTAIAAGGGSSTTFSATAGKTYYFVVDRKASGAVDYVIYARYTSGVCNTSFIEDWQRTPFPRAWTPSEANWQQSQDSPFNATHAKFTGAPVLTNFSKVLQSPVFDTFGCATVKVSFAWRFQQAALHAGVKLRLEVSTDGAGWTELFSYDTGGGDRSEATETITTNTIANSTTARLRFRVDGDTSADVTKFQVDNVKVAP